MNVSAGMTVAFRKRVEAAIKKNLKSKIQISKFDLWVLTFEFLYFVL